MVYIESLNKSIWPFFLKPFEEELFSSWVYRMSLECGIKPIPFTNFCFGRQRPFWNRDIDLIIPEDIINRILNCTPLSRKEILKMSLESYSGYAFEKLKLNSYNQNIGLLGITHRKRKRFGLAYCPSCIENNYYKTSWRLLTSLVCLECEQCLIDRCPSCYSSISFHRINVGIRKKITKALYYCSVCNYDLRKAKRNNKPTNEELNYQLFINDTISKGYNNISSYSFTYIKVLLMLGSKLKTSNNLNQFKINFQDFYNITIPSKKKMFNLLPIDTRRLILVKVNKMLMDWPKTFIEVYNLKKFNNSHLVDNLEKMPYWVYYRLKFKR
ncbi:TniQ family protein [Tenacibaculum sp. Mcav3-52]|uniref:TniQ family protein n=1 Tax=Tenacibaculum sp. Mcav3-52 TaxID=2917762 RepID=UPI002104CFDE|nr:TniQ family protein [Tenacibaculum sp. Mcav3-52]MCG7501080.1 TniQ family protein [Tenacibaculum sp. Mcav3-52]